MTTGGLTVNSMILALAAASASCTLGSATASWLGIPAASLAFVSVYATGCASLAAWMHRSAPEVQQRGAGLAQQPSLFGGEPGEALLPLSRAQDDFLVLGSSAGGVS